jgi:hypothetical protein
MVPRLVPDISGAQACKAGGMPQVSPTADGIQKARRGLISTDTQTKTS